MDLLNALRGNVQETADSLDLKLTQADFIERMNREEDGQSLLDLMEVGEWRVCERLGLTFGYMQGSTAYIDVPRWNNLVEHLRMVNSV
jgi:hypothetical protein